MRWRHTKRSERDYQAAPATVQKAFDKQTRLLSQNLQHPSIPAKKYQETTGLWSGKGM